MRSLDPIYVWGAGAMGGSIGAWLIRAGHGAVFVDSDEAHVEAIRRDGLHISGPVADFTVRAPCLYPTEVERGVETVLLCVKAHHTETALDDLEQVLHPQGFIVSVQNGLNERVIADRVGSERTVGCFVNFGADVIGPGVVMRGNRGACVVGELDGSSGPRIHAIHAILREFEPNAVLTDNIWGYLWGKLAYGSMLFATALAEASIADVLDSQQHRPSLIGLAREAMSVATADDIRAEAFDGFDPAAFARDAADSDAHASLDALTDFNRGSGKTHSGVWRDLAIRKRRTEVDAQIAPIARRGEELGVPTPLTSRLVELIHDVEEGRRAQGWEALDALSANV